MKKKKISKTRGFFFYQEVLQSRAYLDLPVSARDLLHCFALELRFSRRNNRKVYTNNGEVSFTEVQYKAEFKRASNTYMKARDRLIKNGFIKQTYRGGMSRGDRAMYKVLIADDLPIREKRWLRYPHENWKKDIPKAKRTMVGVDTRFKAKPTLKKSTLNGQLHPYEVNPYEH